jgi:hypothetical protein
MGSKGFRVVFQKCDCCIISIFSPQKQGSLAGMTSMRHQSVIGWEVVSWTLCWGWLQTMILWSQPTKLLNIGVSHWLPASSFIWVLWILEHKEDSINLYIILFIELHNDYLMKWNSLLKRILILILIILLGWH